MKVIVKDLETGAYLSVDGQWGASQADARDFFTLLRAYYFARENTSTHFQVILHCPEDDYIAPIADGMGMAAAKAEVAMAPAKAHGLQLREQPIAKRRNLNDYSHLFRCARNDLN